MENELKLLGGAMVTLALATGAMVIVPYFQVKDIAAPQGLRTHTAAESRGREVYIREGCLYCHTQQPGDPAHLADGKRGWGRPSVAADYVNDKPHLLGTMRTGPDLFNIGARQPSVDWHLGHLYQPRAYVPGSIMPSYAYMFEIKPKAEAGDHVVQLPAAYAPASGVVVAKPEAMDLVHYLRALDHTYPVLPAATATRRP